MPYGHQRWYGVIEIQVESIRDLLLYTMPADGLAPSVARPSTGMVMIEFVSCISMGPALVGSVTFMFYVYMNVTSLHMFYLHILAVMAISMAPQSRFFFVTIDNDRKTFLYCHIFPSDSPQDCH